jgi:hypothetical protein
MLNDSGRDVVTSDAIAEFGVQHSQSGNRLIQSGNIFGHHLISQLGAFDKSGEATWRVWRQAPQLGEVLWHKGEFSEK